MSRLLISQFIRYALTTIFNGAIWAIGYNAIEILVDKFKRKK